MKRFTKLGIGAAMLTSTVLPTTFQGAEPADTSQNSTQNVIQSMIHINSSNHHWLSKEYLDNTDKWPYSKKNAEAAKRLKDNKIVRFLNDECLDDIGKLFAKYPGKIENGTYKMDYRFKFELDKYMGSIVADANIDAFSQDIKDLYDIEFLVSPKSLKKWISTGKYLCVPAWCPVQILAGTGFELILNDLEREMRYDWETFDSRIKLIKQMPTNGRTHMILGSLDALLDQSKNHDPKEALKETLETLGESVAGIALEHVGGHLISKQVGKYISKTGSKFFEIGQELIKYGKKNITYVLKYRKAISGQFANELEAKYGPRIFEYLLLDKHGHLYLRVGWEGAIQLNYVGLGMEVVKEGTEKVIEFAAEGLEEFRNEGKIDDKTVDPKLDFNTTTQLPKLQGSSVSSGVEQYRQENPDAGTSHFVTAPLSESSKILHQLKGPIVQGISNKVYNGMTGRNSDGSLKDRPGEPSSTPDETGRVRNKDGSFTVVDTQKYARFQNQQRNDENFAKALDAQRNSEHDIATDPKPGSLIPPKLNSIDTMKPDVSQKNSSTADKPLNKNTKINPTDTVIWVEPVEVPKKAYKVSNSLSQRMAWFFYRKDTECSQEEIDKKASFYCRTINQYIGKPFIEYYRSGQGKNDLGDYRKIDLSKEQLSLPDYLERNKTDYDFYINDKTSSLKLVEKKKTSEGEQK